MKYLKAVLDETKANEPTYKGFDIEFIDGKRQAFNGSHQVRCIEKKDLKKLIDLYCNR